MKDEEKEIPKLLSKFKKKAFLLGLYILVTSQSMTDAALTWLKYECELGIVIHWLIQHIHSFNKYLNVSKVRQLRCW